jgi:hypothetical protein
MPRRPEGYVNPLKGRKRPQSVIDRTLATKAKRREEGHPVRGHPCSETTKQTLSILWKGRTFTDETRQKLSKALKGRPSPNRGKKLSQKEREAVGEGVRKTAARKAALAPPKPLPPPQEPILLIETVEVKVKVRSTKQFRGRLALIHGW